MISVVIAVFNGEKYIEAQLRSILTQTLPPEEVLIFDDGSTDDTVNIVSRFVEENACMGWKLYINSENKGYCRNFLEAVLSAKGEIIFLCDQDDVWYPERIETMVSVTERNPEIAALCCSCDVIDGKGEKIVDPGNIGMLFSENDGSIEYFAADRFVGRSFIRGCSVCFRRELSAYLVPMELKGLLSHDWLITFTAALVGKCAVLNTVLMSYRCHGENNSFGEREYGEAALKRRIEALEYSCDGHSFLLENADSYANMTDKLKVKIKKHIAFERRRIAYLKNGGFKNCLACFFSLNSYKCYYGSIKGAIKVFSGDVIYRKSVKK